jgi:hypothetical protein
LKVFVFASFWWFGRRNGLVSCGETRVRVLKERGFIERAFDGSIAPFVGFFNVIAFRFNFSFFSGWLNNQNESQVISARTEVTFEHEVEE